MVVILDETAGCPKDDLKFISHTCSDLLKAGQSSGGKRSRSTLEALRGNKVFGSRTGPSQSNNVGCLPGTEASVLRIEHLLVF
jgi:hypothetical protein